MRLTPPKAMTFWVATALAVLGLLGQFVDALNPYSVWLVLVGFVVLWIGNAVKGF